MENNRYNVTWGKIEIKLNKNLEKLELEIS